MGPDQEDRDQAGVKAKSKMAEVEAVVAVMERAREVTAFVRIAVRKPGTSKEFPALI
jgi:hypothetical protein